MNDCAIILNIPFDDEYSELDNVNLYQGGLYAATNRK